MRVHVENMRSNRSGSPVANQFIIYAEDGNYFQSYSKVIAFRKRGSNPEWKLDKTYHNYSKPLSSTEINSLA